MARFRKGWDIDQGLLLPPSLSEWLPDDHLAWFVREAVEQLDLDSWLDRYRECGKGKVPYDPRMLLRVLVYAYATDTFSSRRIAKQLEENIAFRVLSGNQMPGHRTICRFRERHIDQFGDVFVQVIQMASSAGLVKMGTIAIDGSKFRANASKHKAMSYERMKKEEKRLRAQIRAIMQLASEEDAKEDELFGPDFRGDELPAELANRETRRQKIMEAKKRLEERKAQEAREEDERKARRAEEEGRDPPTERPSGRKHPKGKPKPTDQENFTDPDSRIMKSSEGFQQSYNAQIAVDADHQLIVANGVTNNAADNGQLQPLIDAAMQNTGKPIDRVLADAGYRAEENLRALEDAHIDAYIALGRENGRPLPYDATRQATERMRRKLKTKRGRWRYRKRKHIAEPVFGWIKKTTGFRGFSLRGLRKVIGEWNLVCLATNLRRMKTMMA